MEGGGWDGGVGREWEGEEVRGFGGGKWGWIGLDWVGLDWIGLGWVGLDWVRLLLGWKYA